MTVYGGLLGVAVTCCLAAAAVGGASAATAPTRTAAAPSQQVAAAMVRSSAAPATIRAGSQSIRVTIPDVLVGPATPTGDGHSRIPVLLAARDVGGSASVPAGGSGCTSRLVPGEVVWLRCAAAAGNRGFTVVVVLDDGRTIARRV